MWVDRETKVYHIVTRRVENISEKHLKIYVFLPDPEWPETTSDSKTLTNCSGEYLQPISSFVTTQAVKR